MDYFNYRNDRLYAEEVPVETIVQKYGTPCYIYSRATLERHWHVFDEAFANHPHHICYAVKANGNLAILNILARLGSGFDIVSLGELERVLVAGGKAESIIFSGVGKQDFEIKRALEVGIGCFNVESSTELYQINEQAKLQNKQARVALRINPNIDPGTHPYITTGKHANKFGMTALEAIETLTFLKNLTHLKLVGLAFHLGSQLMNLEPTQEALKDLLELAERFNEEGFEIEHLDIGGGLGVRYFDEQPPHPSEYAAAVLQVLQNQPKRTIMLEPGRAIAANAGILVIKVINIKHTPAQSFAIVDAGMNDLLRPALYGSWHEIIPVNIKNHHERRHYDIVGPLCESGDFIGKSRKLALQVNDYLVARTAGAYGAVMSSNYNARPRPAEIMVDGTNDYLVRQRETIRDLFSLEKVIP